MLEKWTADYELQKMQINKSGKTDKETQLALLREEYFSKYDEYLDKKGDKHYFKDDNLARVVANSLSYWDHKRIELICYSIMHSMPGQSCTCYFPIT